MNLVLQKKNWLKYLRENRIREYFEYRMNQISETLLHKPCNKDKDYYAGKHILSYVETNRMISDAIITSKPFWAGRYGMTELQMMIQTINSNLCLSNTKEKNFLQLCNNAGFFPKEDLSGADRFTELMTNACENIDLHAVWPMNMEDYFIKYYENRNVKLTRLWQLEPWQPVPCECMRWSEALAGKKVLVIHPFAETIQDQYNNRRSGIFGEYFKDREILPEFDLKTIKAVQTIAGETDNRFKSWFDALQYMIDECKNTDFDVAIIGCGAYGFPLAAEIKKMGKVAIHLGGATQLLFGIIGKRWESDNYKIFNKDIVNEYWVRPSDKDKVKSGNKVEDGCYW